MSKKVMISSGETSGELYGALLSRELKSRWPDIELFGVGGSQMEAAGVSIIAPVTHVLGIIEVFRHIFDIRRSFKKARMALLDKRPDVLILIDYPDFNIALARKAKDANIPILYYVSPQVWAWRPGRIKKIAALVNKMAVLFPFEVEYYQSSGLECEFVGHPVAERISISKSKEELKRHLGLDADRKVISFLPGSRPNEIKKHLSIVLHTAEKLRGEFPDAQILIPLTSGTVINEEIPDFIKVIHDDTISALACSEVAAVASGTATLETALVGTPMVVFYRISPATYMLGRMLATVEFISLVNILSEKEVVKELLQRDANADNIFAELRKILLIESYRDNMLQNINKIRDIMKDRKPSARVAEITGEIAGWEKNDFVI